MRCRDKGVSRSGAGASRLRRALELAVEARHWGLGGFWYTWIRTFPSVRSSCGQLVYEFVANLV